MPMAATIPPRPLSPTPADQTAIVITPVNATCGNANGSVTLGAVTGGVAPYTYSFDGSGFTSTTVYNNLAAATYNVIVRDANGCDYPTTATVAIPADQRLLLSRQLMQPVVIANGSVTLGAVTGGVAPLYVFLRWIRVYFHHCLQ
jgi:hypothetical protein